MSYTLSVQNGSEYQMQASDGQTVPPNGNWNPSGVHGNAWIQSTELGTLWGVLISYQGEEIVGRYEGAGGLTVALNEYGQATLSGMDFRQVFLPSFTQ
jgi:hypothetical protein